MPTSFGPRTLDIAGLRRSRGLETEPPLRLLRDASRQRDPLYYFVWGLLVASLPFTDLSLVKQAKSFGQPSTFLVALLWVLLLPEISKRSFWSLLGVRTVQLLILFWVICGASVFLSSQAPSAQWLNTSPWSKSLRQFLQLSTDVSVAVFTVHFVRSWKDFRRTMNWYFLGFITAFFAGVAELADGYLRSDWAARLTELLHTFGPRQYMASGFRLQLLAYEPSMAADYLLHVIPFFALGAYFWRRQVWSFLASAVSFLMFLGTFSLGGAIALLGEMGTAALTVRRRHLAAFALSLTLSTLVIFAINPDPLAWMVDRARGIMTWGRETEEFSARDRAAKAESAWNTFREHPWVGVGIGDSMFYLPGSYPTWAARDRGLLNQMRSDDEGAYTVGNFFITVFSETGIIGGAAFITLLATLLRGCYRALKRATNPAQKKACAAVLVVLVGQFIHYFALSQLAFRYWFFIWGLAVFLARPGVVSESPRPPTALRPFRIRRQTLTAGSSKPAFAKEPAST